MKPCVEQVASATASTPPVRLGPYELLEVVGRGGMGTVYRARHLDSGQTVAVKVMAPGLTSSPVLLKRFEQEFSAATRLRHPHVVQGLGLGVADGRPYLVMEFVPGQNLGQRVRESGPFSEAEALRLTLQIVNALELAHQCRLIHRDIKPENILLTADGQAKLADLGLIKDIDGESSLTRTRSCLGTAAFMAPEQFDDAKHADARCDVYGLAATLYYLLTGVVPFQGRGNLTILRKKLRNDFPPPRQFNPALREALSEVICRALDANADRRPASCRELGELLAAAAPDPDGPSASVEPSGTETAAFPPPSRDRRAAPRYPCTLGAACGPVHGGNHRTQGEILDISLTGIHLRLDRPFESGAVLKVEVMDTHAAVISTWLVQVRWVRSVAPEQWSVGCALNRELSESELDELLENLPPTVVIEVSA